MNVLPALIAETTGPLFGNAWLALLAILAGVAVFMFLVAAAGRWLAATHDAAVAKHVAVALKGMAPATTAAPASPAVAVPTGSAVTSAPIEAPAPVATRATVMQGPPPEVLVILAAAVAVTFGRNARIAEVRSLKPVATSVEMLMQHWSMEGRRQIYSSHQIR